MAVGEIVRWTARNVGSLQRRPTIVVTRCSLRLGRRRPRPAHAAAPAAYASGGRGCRGGLAQVRLCGGRDRLAAADLRPSNNQFI